MRRFTHSALVAAAALGLIFAGAGRAYPQTLLDQVKLISSVAVAAVPVAPAQSFTISAAGSYTVTLTDRQSPVALASLQLAVATSGASVLQLSAAGTMASQAVTLQPGNYSEQVLASAASGALGGAFSVTVTAANGTPVPVTPAGGTTAANAFVGAVGPATAATPPAGQSVLQTQFSINATGAYQLTLTDRAFPAALTPASFDIAVWNQAAPGTLLLSQSGVNAGSFAIGAGSLAAGSYELVVVAQAAAPALAGLYSFNIASVPAGSSVLAMSVPVGSLPPASLFSVPVSGSLTLTLRDMTWPAALASVQAVLVQGATVLQPSVNAGTYTVTNAAAGSAQWFVAAEPGASAGEGSFNSVISQVGQTLLDIAEPVTDSSHSGYAFSTELSAAGDYQLGINDFQIPSPLSSVSAAVEQGGVMLASTTLSAGGTATLSPQPAAAPLNFVAFATASAVGGLFGLELTSVPAGTLAYQTTQAVGSDFSSQTLAVPTAGSYQVSLTDLGFPASFSSLNLIVTSGEQTVGEISADSEFTFQATTATNYTLSVLGRTGAAGGATANYGLYGVHVAATTTPPSPPPTPSASSSAGGGGGSLSLVTLAALMLALIYRRRPRVRQRG